jgi:hypothetical protein
MARMRKRRTCLGCVALKSVSSVSPTCGEKELSVWNGHYECTYYYPLFRILQNCREHWQSWFRSSEQDSAKAKWTAAGVGPLQFRARGVTEGGRSPTRDTSCARRKSHAAAARGDGVK